MTLVIGRRLFTKHWFEHSIAEFRLTAFTIAAAAVTAALIAWRIRRAGQWSGAPSTIRY